VLSDTWLRILDLIVTWQYNNFSLCHAAAGFKPFSSRSVVEKSINSALTIDQSYEVLILSHFLPEPYSSWDSNFWSHDQLSRNLWAFLPLKINPVYFFFAFSPCALQHLDSSLWSYNQLSRNLLTLLPLLSNHMNLFYLAIFSKCHAATGFKPLI
jgi:hypothetical protein